MVNFNIACFGSCAVTVIAQKFLLIYNQMMPTTGFWWKYTKYAPFVFLRTKTSTYDYSLNTSRFTCPETAVVLISFFQAVFF